MKNTIIVTIAAGLICLSAYMIHAIEQPTQPVSRQSIETLTRVSPVTGINRDTSKLIIAQLISAIIYTKLAQAKKDFPNTPEAELRADSIANIKRILLTPKIAIPSFITLSVEQLEAPEPVAVSEQAPAQPVPAGKDYSLTGWLKWLVGAK